MDCTDSNDDEMVYEDTRSNNNEMLYEETMSNNDEMFYEETRDSPAYKQPGGKTALKEAEEEATYLTPAETTPAKTKSENVLNKTGPQ